MSGIINYTPAQLSDVQNFAAGLAGRAQQVADKIVELYRGNYAMLWRREGWDVSNVQEIADEMGTNFTALMQLNGALGAFIATNYPDAVPAEELASPVSYTVNGDGTLTFDAEGDYPGPIEE